MGPGLTVLGNLKNRLVRPDDVSSRLAGLEAAVAAARGRLDPELLQHAEAVIRRSQDRVRLSADHTVVALAGATGSGKSSLFNRLCGLEIAAVGVRRPTTSEALACSWGPGAGELLEWLGIPPRHQVDRASALDNTEPQQDLHGLVLLDLPDHDSTEVAHHLEVERLVRLVDVIIWVLDPQKYADAAIHERFLRPLASYREVMLVVFNHVDELGVDAAAAAIADTRRLLAADGLGELPVIATSARRGDGVVELRAELAKRVERKRSATARVSADVALVAQRLAAETGPAQPASLTGVARDELVDACATAAGVPVVVAAVEASYRRRCVQQTGWPLTRWLTRLRPDPLRRLHLGRSDASHPDGGVAVARSSLPAATPVQRASVAAAVRGLADTVAVGLPPAWAATTHQVSMARTGDVSDALDAAVAGTDVDTGRVPRWWSAVTVVQWVLLVAAAVGASWLAALAGIAYLHLPDPPDPRSLAIPWPTWLLVGGLVLGLVVAALCRAIGGLTARRRARRAEARLRSAVGEVVDDLVVRPVQAEVDAYRACRKGLARALG